MKNTVILLIFLLAVVGLIIGVCYTEDSNTDRSQDSDFNIQNEDIDSDLTINHAKNNDYFLNMFSK